MLAREIALRDQLGEAGPERAGAAVRRVAEARRREPETGERGLGGPPDRSHPRTRGEGGEQPVEDGEVALDQGALGRPVAEGAARAVRVPGERVPEQDAARAIPETAPDDGARGLEPERRVAAGGPEQRLPRPGEPDRVAPRELALAGERDAREPAAAVA